MNTVFALDQSFSRTNTLKSRCQSSSLNTETKKFRKRSELPWPTGTGAARRVAFMLYRRHHVARPRSRRRPAPARRTRQLHLLPSRLHRAQRRATAVHHCRPSLRPRLAPASLQKRVAQFAQSLAVIPSTTSTVQSSQLSLGKHVFASSSTAAMSGLAGVGAPRGQLSSRPLPSLLSLALGPVNATEARRVTR